MTGWMVFAGYLVAWLGSGWWLTRRTLIGIERGKAGFVYTSNKLDGEDRGMAAMAGFGLSLFLPVIAVLAVLLWDVLTSRTNLFRTPNEIAEEHAERQAAELAAYRRQAQEFGLPIPEVPER